MAGYILMTAMPPTKGHEYLIRFARNFLMNGYNGPLNVILCTQPHEPMVYERFAAVTKLCTRISSLVGWINIHHYGHAIQQTPNGDDPKFWEMWKDIFTRKLGLRLHEGDILFSSEEYGFKLADVLGIKHIPVDIKRQVNSISGTRVRKMGPWFAFENVIDEFKPYLKKTVTVFGAESTGKTTLAQSLAWRNNDYKFLHEWARPYLEAQKSPEVTQERLFNIVKGQHAAQMAVSSLDNYHMIIRDTDLLSTIGYYRIYDKRYKVNKNYQYCVRLFLKSKADLYLLTKSNIPFVADPLRYGGDERESTDQFWIDLLREFDCNYRVIDAFAPHTRVYQGHKYIEELSDNKLWGYVRE